VCYGGAAKRALWLFVAPFCDTVPTWFTSKQKMRQGKKHANGKQSSKKAPRLTSRIHGHRK